MRSISLVTIAVALAFMTFASRAETELPQYFPDGEFSDFMSAVYSAELTTLREPPLYGTVDATGETYRLLYVPSFEGSVSVRIDVAEDGATTMRVAEGLFDTEYTIPGTIKSSSERVLSAVEFSTFKGAFDSMDICSAPIDEVLGLDGYNFVFEWRSGDQYCMAERWAPDAGPFLSAGELMLKMAGIW